MKINELKPKQGSVDIIVDVIDIGDVREFQKFGKSGKVATAIAKDETGDIKLTLWNDDIDRVNMGDSIHITNGYVNEWQGEMQLTTGRMGKLEVIGKTAPQQSDPIKTNIAPQEGDKDFDSDKDISVEEEDIDIEEEEI